MTPPWVLIDEACNEAYSYFDRRVRRLPRTADGKFDPKARGLVDNDVDAFRHGYVSGVFTQEYGESAARTFGNLNELNPIDSYSDQRNPGARNMDLWNNAVGRKYGLKTKNRKELFRRIHRAMRNGELILSPKDQREYKGSRSSGVSATKPVIVLQETRGGGNTFYYDTRRKVVLSRDEFVAEIAAGHYPGYSTRLVRGTLTPVSKPDDRNSNNLG